MLQQLLVPARADRILQVDRSALLVLDMQRYFLEPDSHAYVPSARATLPNILAMVDAFASKARPVIFTRHLNTPQDAAMMSEWWRDMITGDSDLSEITGVLDTSKGGVLEKSQYDAFYNTTLEEMLQREGVTQLVISGVLTHLCCETTARSAFVRGFEVFFTVDGTATYNQEFHMASLQNLSHGFATPVLVRAVLASIASEGMEVD